jgi:hypothetical protein
VGAAPAAAASRYHFKLPTLIYRRLLNTKQNKKKNKDESH